MLVGVPPELTLISVQTVVTAKKKKTALSSGSAHSSLHTELKDRRQAQEENLAYFFPPLMQVLSVLIYEKTLLFTEAMKLNFQKWT